MLCWSVVFLIVGFCLLCVFYLIRGIRRGFRPGG